MVLSAGFDTNRIADLVTGGVGSPGWGAVIERRGVEAEAIVEVGASALCLAGVLAAGR